MSKSDAAITSPTHPTSHLHRRFFKKAILAYEMAKSDILDDIKSEPVNPQRAAIISGFVNAAYLMSTRIMLYSLVATLLLKTRSMNAK